MIGKGAFFPSFDAGFYVLHYCLDIGGHGASINTLVYEGRTELVQN